MAVPIPDEALEAATKAFDEAAAIETTSRMYHVDCAITAAAPHIARAARIAELKRAVSELNDWAASEYEWAKKSTEDEARDSCDARAGAFESAADHFRERLAELEVETDENV